MEPIVQREFRRDREWNTLLRMYDAGAPALPLVRLLFIWALLGTACEPQLEGPEPGLFADAADAAYALDPSGLAKSGCPAEMVALPGACMDRYEAPGLAGEKPLAMRTALEGEAYCAGRGKRLCTEAEWVRACQGASGRPYPYGAAYKRGTCNDDKVWRVPSWSTLATWPSDAAKAEASRLYQADTSGSRPGCVSQEGVFDLTGNVAEWVRRSYANRTNYDHVMKGCYWSGCYGGSGPSCSFVNSAHPGVFRTYEAGFRCCKDLP